MILVNLCLFVCVNLFLYAKCSIPVERLCANPTCEEPISKAQGSVQYISPSREVLGFKKGQEITIVSKSKNAKDYWGAIIKGKFGYVPSHLIKEVKIFHSVDKLIPVAVEIPKQSLGESIVMQNESSNQSSLINNGIRKSNLPQSTESIGIINNQTLNFEEKPVKIDQAVIPTESVGVINNQALKTVEKPIKPDPTFKIIEGTTIFADEPDEISPSSTVDKKSADQTVNPMIGNSNKKVDIEKRARIPPEIIDLNSNYKKQKLEEKNGFIIENVKENDENTTVETKDISANDDEEEDEEDDEEGEGDEEDDEYDLEDDLAEEKENQVTGNLFSEPKKNVAIDKSKSNAEVNEQIEVMKANTDSIPWHITENKAEAVVNIVENSVSSKMSAKIGKLQTKPATEELSEKITQPSFQSTGFNEAGAPAQDSSPTWSILNEYKENLPPIVSGLNTPSPPATRSSSAKYFQTVKSGSPELPVESSNSPAESGFQTTPSESQTKFPELQAELLNSQAKLPELQADLSEIQVKSPELQTQEEHPEPQVEHPELQAKPPESQILKQFIKNEPSPSVQLSVAPEVLNGADALQQVTTEASFVTIENATDGSSQILEAASPSAAQEVLAETFTITPHPVASESSMIFSQFSVSADSLPENSGNNVKERSLTSDIIQEPVEVTTEAFPVTSVATETSNKLSSSSQAWKHINSANDYSLKTSEEKFEGAVEVSVTPSSFPQVVSEEIAVVDDTTPHQDLEKDATSVENAVDKLGMVSQILRIFSSWFSSASDKELNSESDPTNEAALADIRSNAYSKVKQETFNESPSGSSQCDESSDCTDSVQSEVQPSFWSSWILSGLNAESIVTSSNTFIYLVVTAVTVLLFTLGHNFIEKNGKTGPLIAKINKLEHELLISSKECLQLKDEVLSLREKIVLYENSANDELVLSLQGELEESKKIRSELESSIEVLQQELDAATEAGLDLNKMLSEVLTQKGGSESLLKSVESLQAQLDSQQKVIDEMTKKLGVKNQENEALQAALDAANDRSESLEEQLSDVKFNLDLRLKEKEDLAKDSNSQINQLKTRIHQLGESKEKEISRVKKELEELQKKLLESSGTLTIREEELNALKESVKHLKGKGDVKLEAVFDFSRVKGELAKEVKENQALMERFQREEKSRKVLEEQVKLLNEEMLKLKKGCEEAEQKKDEAEKKLEVLSTYFKEKETQLQKELGLQEALWAQKKGDEKAVYNMMKSLQEEVESYKSQNETLKQEILDQERGLKNQCAALEQKAHENWVAARQAERKLEESKQELAQLRNRLTLVEKNNSNAEGKGNLRSSEELNGVEAASPALHDTSSPLLFPPLPLDPNSTSLLPPGFMPPPMFMPPPIGGFIPPPPFLPGDRRPPPLGRMSSPPLNNRFSPSSPADYPFERMSSPPLSPPSSNYRSLNEDREHYRHRTPPYPPPLHPRNWDDNNEIPGFIPISSQRDPRRDHKGSNVSSEHSSSESLDKSSRHSGRV